MRQSSKRQNGAIQESGQSQTMVTSDAGLIVNYCGRNVDKIRASSDVGEMPAVVRTLIAICRLIRLDQPPSDRVILGILTAFSVSKIEHN
jgi:hypothetical protein